MINTLFMNIQLVNHYSTKNELQEVQKMANNILSVLNSIENGFLINDVSIKNAIPSDFFQHPDNSQSIVLPPQKKVDEVIEQLKNLEEKYTDLQRENYFKNTSAHKTSEIKELTTNILKKDKRKKFPEPTQQDIILNFLRNNGKATLREITGCVLEMGFYTTSLDKEATIKRILYQMSGRKLVKKKGDRWMAVA